MPQIGLSVTVRPFPAAEKDERAVGHAGGPGATPAVQGARRLHYPRPPADPRKGSANGTAAGWALHRTERTAAPAPCWGAAVLDLDVDHSTDRVWVCGPTIDLASTVLPKGAGEWTFGRSAAARSTAHRCPSSHRESFRRVLGTSPLWAARPKRSCRTAQAPPGIPQVAFA